MKISNSKFFFKKLKFFRKVLAELSTVRDKLRESQAQIAALLTTTQSLEREINEYKKRFNVVKKILRVSLFLFFF